MRPCVVRLPEELPHRYELYLEQLFDYFAVWDEVTGPLLERVLLCPTLSQE